MDLEEPKNIDPDHPRRKNLLVYPEFQMKLVLGQALLMALVFGFSILIAWIRFRKIRERGVLSGLSTDHPFFLFVDEQQDIILSGLFAGFGVGVIFSTLWILVLSNEIAGPITRLREYFTEINALKEEDPIPSLRFRKGDFFQDLPEIIENSLKAIRRKP